MDVNVPKKDLAQLELTVASIPHTVGFADALADPRNRAAIKRNVIRACRPSGARLDDAKAALERAKARMEQAIEAV